MAAKRALIFSFVYYPRFIGGAEVALKEITDRIAQSDIEFDLIALRLDKNLPKIEKIGNVTVHRIGWSGEQRDSSDSLSFYLHMNKYAYPFLSAFYAASLHSKQKFDFIWAMMATYSGFGALFFKIFHKTVPFLLTLQEGDPIEYIKKRVQPVAPLFKMIFTRADYIQTISNYLADFAKDMGATCPVRVVPNGVDIKYFSQTYSLLELDVLKQSLGKEQGDVFLITMSRLVIKNAVSDIVGSLAYLPNNVKLLVLGTGYELAALKKQAADLGVTSRVNFLGFVSHKEMPKYLAVSDVFIRPSISEGFGNSFIEAMASGVPVIATAVGGIVDFLKNKETGLFCDVKSPEDVARKVEIYLHDVNLRNEIIDNARKMVNEKYDWNLVSDDMKEKVFDVLV